MNDVCVTNRDASRRNARQHESTRSFPAPPPRVTCSTESSHSNEPRPILKPSFIRHLSLFALALLQCFHLGAARYDHSAPAAAARRGLNRSNLGASKHLGLQRIDAIDTDKALSWKTHHSVLRYEQYGSTRGRGCV